MKSIGGNLSPQGMLSQACEDDEEEEEGGPAAAGGGDNRAATDSTAAEDGDNSSSGSDDGDDDDNANVIKSCPTSPARLVSRAVIAPLHYSCLSITVL